MDSTPEQIAEGKAVVSVLAAVLDRLVKSNSSQSSNNYNNKNNGEEITKFHALKAPGISIKQYLERIHKYASCSTECFVLALIYIDRLIQNNNFILSELNVHRVLITAILLAAKFFDDAYYNNAYYAKVGGVLVSEMNGLEVEFLFRINFSLHVKPDVFLKYQDELVNHVVGGGIDQQQWQQQQQQFQPQQQHQSQQYQQQQEFLIQGHSQQQQLQTDFAPSVIPAPNLNHFAHETGVANNITMNNQLQPCGNVTPSPPLNKIDYDSSQQEQEQQHIQHHMQQSLHDIKHEQRQQQQFPIHQPQTQPIIFSNNTSISSQYNTSTGSHHHPYLSFKDTIQQQQQQQQQAKQISIQKNFQHNNMSLSPKDILYATCCPYGGRFNPNSSPVLFNAATRIFQ
jgi:hypothetical protein